MADAVKHTPLTASDLRVGASYRAKRPQRRWTFDDGHHFNDRTIIHIDQLGTSVQYDGPAVALGRRYPTTGIETFLRWASHEITEGAA